MKILHLIILGTVCIVPSLGMAQWQWVDKDGRKVFSDQSPPPEIPVKSILKQPASKNHPPSTELPGASTTDAATAAASAPAVTAKAALSAPKIGGKDRELEEKKKLADAAEDEKKKAEQENVAKIKADNCARAKQGKANFDSGVRIGVTNSKGEREIMTDATRAVEVKRLQGIMASDCKPA